MEELARSHCQVTLRVRARSSSQTGAHLFLSLGIKSNFCVLLLVRTWTVSQLVYFCYIQALVEDVWNWTEGSMCLNFRATISRSQVITLSLVHFFLLSNVILDLNIVQYVEFPEPLIYKVLVSKLSNLRNGVSFKMLQRLHLQVLWLDSSLSAQGFTIFV